MALTSLRIRVAERWYSVQVGDLSRSPVEVIVEGETFLVEFEGLSPRQPRRARHTGQGPSQIAPLPPQRRGSPSDSADNIVRAPMPGRVISIRVRPGDRVSEGDELCVVEAMKMEQSIRATRAGTVGAVHVQPMDSVAANEPLIELDG